MDGPGGSMRSTPAVGAGRGGSASPRRPVPAMVRHVVVGVLTGGLVMGFWWSRMEWSPDMRLWRAVGDAAVVLLFASLAMGPTSRIWRLAARALHWRRQVGIWAAAAALVHGLLVFWGWTGFSFSRLLGYEFIPQLGRTARMEPGFGLANLLGVVALAWLLVMMVTSSDAAVRRLGPSAWKWLHTSAYVVFYLSALHTVYFLFMHYTASFHRAVPEPNWFRFPLLGLAIAVLGLQVVGLVVTRSRRGALTGRGAG